MCSLLSQSHSETAARLGFSALTNPGRYFFFNRALNFIRHSSPGWRIFQSSGSERPGRVVRGLGAREPGRNVQTRAADRFAETVLLIIVSLQKSGVTSLRGLAIALNNRGVRTARDGEWQVSNVRNVLARIGATVS